MPKTKSEIWNYFVKTSDGGECKWCNKHVKSCGNTTNLRSHIMHNHPELDMNSSKKNQTSSKRQLNECVRIINILNIIIVYYYNKKITS